MRTKHSAILILLASLLITACDRGIYYQPKDWTKEEHPWFTKSFGQLDIKITDLGGLISQDHFIPEVMIHNRVKSPIFLERAILKANGAEYSAHPFGEPSWESVPPNETRRLALYFDFGKGIYEILKDPVEMTLMLRVGDEQRDISIPMVKLVRGK
ncbi:MAG TPA: hypothetical protein VF543_19230 [Pyrinomonadaceae bacterium]|jgi:hypothetical protein